MKSKLLASYERNLVVPAILLLIMGSACSKGRTLEFSDLRKFPDFNTTTNFVESHSFHSAREPKIYLVFFDTLRPDTALARKGAIQDFYDHNLTFNKSYGTGTATWYSMFSFFHGSPGFLAYDVVPKVQSNTDVYGSIFLKIFHKLGYKINIYGFDWRCDLEEQPSGTSWKRFLMTYFGWKSRLLDRCQKEPNYDDKFLRNQDEITVAELEEKLPSVITSPSKNLSFITFFNNHSPYKWAAAESGVSENIGQREDFSEIRTTSNRYLNSVVSSDLNFAHLMRLINSLPGNENAIIVLFSDHGEMLYEKRRESGHGGTPYKEKIETLLAMHLPEEPSLQNKLDSASIATTADIFPTLFDYLGVSPEIPSEWLTGRSLIRQQRTSAVIVQSNLEDPTRDMVLVNREGQKAWIHVDERDFYISKSFRIIKITNLDDRNGQEPCKDMTSEECKQLLQASFPEAIKELYPSF